MNKKHIFILAALTVLFVFWGIFLGLDKKVTINVDGREISVITKCRKVESLLKERNVAVTRDDFLDPCAERYLKEGDIIHVRKAVPIEIAVDGKLHTLTHHTLDTEEILSKAGIELAALDRVTGRLSKDILPVRLQVVRVRESVLEVEETVPFSREQIMDSALKMGEKRLVQQGADGLEKKSYLVRYENGREAQRTAIVSQVLRAMKKEVVKIGIKNSIVLASRSLTEPRRELYLQATAYTHTGNTTFTGVYPRAGTVAVDPKVIPLGSRLWIEGYGYGIAQDTGGVIKGNIIDLFMDTREECLHWGRRMVKVYILE